MNPLEALQLLEQIAAGSAMPLAMHMRAKEAVKVLLTVITEGQKKEE